jgi:hypothetical protein
VLLVLGLLAPDRSWPLSCLAEPLYSRSGDEQRTGGCCEFWVQSTNASDGSLGVERQRMHPSPILAVCVKAPLLGCGCNLGLTSSCVSILTRLLFSRNI